MPSNASSRTQMCEKTWNAFIRREPKKLQLLSSSSAAPSNNQRCNVPGMQHIISGSQFLGRNFSCSAAPSNNLHRDVHVKSCVKRSGMQCNFSGSYFMESCYSCSAAPSDGLHGDVCTWNAARHQWIPSLWKELQLLRCSIRQSAS